MTTLSKNNGIISGPTFLRTGILCVLGEWRFLTHSEKRVSFPTLLGQPLHAAEMLAEQYVMAHYSRESNGQVRAL